MRGRGIFIRSWSKFDGCCCCCCCSFVVVVRSLSCEELYVEECFCARVKHIIEGTIAVEVVQ